MILIKDLDFVSDIAENKTGLYDMITKQLGLDEKQQEMLVDELKYQFSYCNECVANVKEYEAELEERNEYLEDSVEELEYENADLEDENYELREEIDRLQEENEELRNGLND